MKIYVGTKIIQGEPMDENIFVNLVKGEPWEPSQPGQPPRPGYKVIYPDGYVSWSPKETFENAYREVTREEKTIIWQDH